MRAREKRAAPRKRPTQARAEATVGAILVASGRIFRERGLERASVNAIARLAGVSVGSLYQYFPSKDALLVALAQHHTNGALDALERTLQSVETSPLRTAVRDVVEQMVASHADPLHRVLAHGLDALGSATSLQQTIDARAGAAVERFLRTRRSELTVQAPDLAALLLVRAVDQLTHAAIERAPETLEDGRLVEELCALVVGYLLIPREAISRSSRTRRA